MSLIDKGHNEVADQVYTEVVEEGRVPTTSDVIALSTEIVRLAKLIDATTEVTQ
jgi:hypothetical protein